MESSFYHLNYLASQLWIYRNILVFQTINWIRSIQLDIIHVCSLNKLKFNNYMK